MASAVSAASLRVKGSRVGVQVAGQFWEGEARRNPSPPTWEQVRQADMLPGASCTEGSVRRGRARSAPRDLGRGATPPATRRPAAGRCPARIVKAAFRLGVWCLRHHGSARDGLRYRCDGKLGRQPNTDQTQAPQREEHQPVQVDASKMYEYIEHRCLIGGTGPLLLHPRSLTRLGIGRRRARSVSDPTAPPPEWERDGGGIGRVKKAYLKRTDNRNRPPA